MEGSKICRECGKGLPYSSFYKHKAMLDGHLNKCKDCVKTRVKAHRKKNVERVRAYDRNRGSRQTAEDVRTYRKNNPKKYKAHLLVNNTLRSGGIVKQEKCEVCGKHPTCGHHDDYDKPLDVRWLCQVCHKAWHSEHGEGLNAK